MIRGRSVAHRWPSVEVIFCYSGVWVFRLVFLTRAYSNAELQPAPYIREYLEKADYGRYPVAVVPFHLPLEADCVFFVMRNYGRMAILSVGQVGVVCFRKLRRVVAMIV